MNDKWKTRAKDFYQGACVAITVLYLAALIAFQWTDHVPLNARVAIIAGAVLWFVFCLYIEVVHIKTELDARSRKSLRYMEDNAEWRESVERRLLELSMCDESERELMELHGMTDEESEGEDEQ